MINRVTLLNRSDGTKLILTHSPGAAFAKAATVQETLFALTAELEKAAAQFRWVAIQHRWDK
jgi:hypothetical protein